MRVVDGSVLGVIRAMAEKHGGGTLAKGPTADGAAQ